MTEDVTEFLGDASRLLAADLRKSTPTKGAYQDALRRAVAIIEQLAEVWEDGYDAGNKDVRAVNALWPATTPNPYAPEFRSEQEQA